MPIARRQAVNNETRAAEARGSEEIEVIKFCHRCGGLFKKKLMEFLTVCVGDPGAWHCKRCVKELGYGK